MRSERSSPARAQEDVPGARQEIRSGQRFAFGKNWQGFLTVLDEERITIASRSLQDTMGLESLAGRTFLDVGSGSGLFSLAAMHLGAARVHSFDYDPESVACTRELKSRFFPMADTWTIERGDILDDAYVRGLGAWDIVYSWGVLHHTGDMWRALATVDGLVKPGGLLFISIYNDQGRISSGWKAVKRAYNRSRLQRALVTGIFIPYFAVRSAVGDILRGRNPVRQYRDYRKSRGMSRTHDWFDWLGGYPFEVARPEQIFKLFRERGYILEHLTTRNGLGCNEFVLRKP